MHHSEERSDGAIWEKQRKRSEERKPKHVKSKEIWMYTDVGSSVFPDPDGQNEVKGEIKMRWQMGSGNISWTPVKVLDLRHNVTFRQHLSVFFFRISVCNRLAVCLPSVSVTSTVSVTGWIGNGALVWHVEIWLVLQTEAGVHILTFGRRSHSCGWWRKFIKTGVKLIGIDCWQWNTHPHYLYGCQALCSQSLTLIKCQIFPSKLGCYSVLDFKYIWLMIVD